MVKNFFTVKKSVILGEVRSAESGGSAKSDVRSSKEGKETKTKTDKVADKVGEEEQEAEVEAKLIESLSEEDRRELDGMEQEGRKGVNRITCLPPSSKTRFQHRCRSGLPTVRTAAGS